MRILKTPMGRHVEKALGPLVFISAMGLFGAIYLAPLKQMKNGLADAALDASKVHSASTTEPLARVETVPLTHSDSQPTRPTEEPEKTHTDEASTQKPNTNEPVSQPKPTPPEDPVSIPPSFAVSTSEPSVPPMTEDTPPDEAGPARDEAKQNDIDFLPTSQVNTRIRPAIVNIICTTRRGGTFKPVTGSGVIIDSRGVILTNAHVGQYLLLDDRISCIVRTGSPARPAYTAQLLYLPPSWIDENSTNLIQSNPTGTGEHDWALISVGAALSENAPLPPSLPFAPFKTDTDDIPEQNRVLLAAYPAELIGGITTQINLNLVSTEAMIARGFYFYDEFPEAIDLVSFGGTILAQGGSSGGAVVDLMDGTLMGIIVTSTTADSTEDKDLRAITLSHVDRSMRAHLGVGLRAYLESDIDDRFDAFHATDFQTDREILLNSANAQ